MLIALLVLLFVGSDTFGARPDIRQLEKNIRAELPRGDAREAALDIVARVSSNMESRNKYLKKAAFAIEEVIDYHEASDADIEAAVRSFRQTQFQFNRTMIDLRFELKQHVTEEQWRAIFAFTLNE